jgi:CheY-like chemotaxis protein
VRVDELLATTTLQLSPTLPGNVRLEASANPALAVVRGDERQLIQALCNLVGNAVEAMPDGGTVTVSAENEDVHEVEARTHPGASAGPHVLLSVSDTGPGIPADVLDHVFDPFFTTKPRDRHAGLGLSVVRGVVRRHNGFLDADSPPGKGARVRIWLPAAYGPTPSKNGLERLALLADDGPASLQAGRHALEQAGLRVVTASNGPEALLAYHRQMGHVAVAVVAASLPILDGPATLRALRQADSSLPLVLMTRGDPPSAALDELGGVTWLPQPFTPDSLVSAVRSALSSNSVGGLPSSLTKE